MKRKLNCVLLIDDNEADNFLHEKILRKAGITDHVVSVKGGQEALEYLTSENKDENQQPDIIFLDINMPGMDGWEFLEEYNKLYKKHRGRMIVVMLTTSLNPDDSKRAQTVSVIDIFKNKPLTVGMIQELLQKHFPDYV